MDCKSVLHIDRDLDENEDENVRVFVIRDSIWIHNTATDAKFWSVIFSLDEWIELKKFIDDQLNKING